MSVREGIEGWFSPGIRRAVSRELDKYRDEVLREAAEKQRAGAPYDMDNPCTCDLDFCEACDTRKLIDLIDPDKDN